MQPETADMERLLALAAAARKGPWEADAVATTAACSPDVIAALVREVLTLRGYMAQLERAYNSAEQRGDMWRTRALEAAEFIEDAAYWFFNVNQKQAGNECVAAARRARGE